MATTVPGRAEIAPEHTWDLTAIYNDDAAWETEFAALPAAIEEVEGYEGRLGQDAATLLAAMQAQDRLGQRLERLAVYALLRRDEDTALATYQALADRAQQIYVRASAAGSYFSPELLGLPDGTLERFQAAEPGLAVYAHLFEDLLRGKPHVLSEAEEQLLAQAGEMAAAPSTIYHMLTDADLQFGTVEDEEGTEAVLTEGRYGRYMRSHNRRLREEAFTKLLTVYHAHRNVCAASFSSNVKKDIFYARARKYPSALEAALQPDNIPVSVYDNLISAVHANLPQLHRYLDLRRRVLKLDELHMYDLHVPLLVDTTNKVEYSEATQQVLSAFAPLGAEYVDAVRQGFAARWIDVYETPNKRSGAYSWGSYDTNPYILLNYQDTLQDLFTLAHELGHTMHSYYTRQEQPYVYGNYTIFVAEVASTLNEALLTHYLLQNTDDPRVRLAIVNNNLDNYRGTLYRQTMFAEFEKITHAAAEAGEALTADRLSEMFLALNQQYYGPGVVSDELIATEWARIPHFYSSFYVYKYATGISAAAALAQQIIQEGAPAIARYRRFLTRGSSTYSIDLLRDAGVDMTTPQPVDAALAYFGSLLDQMEGLLAETGLLERETATADA